MLKKALSGIIKVMSALQNSVFSIIEGYNWYYDKIFWYYY